MSQTGTTSDERIPGRAFTEGPFSPAFHAAAELVGRRWTSAILFAVAHDVHRFSELRAAIPGLSSRLLTERLRELEQAGILERVSRSDSRRLDYQLTAKGDALRPVLMALNRWAVVWEADHDKDARHPAKTRIPSSRADASGALGGIGG